MLDQMVLRDSLDTSGAGSSDGAGIGTVCGPPFLRGLGAGECVDHGMIGGVIARS